MVEFKRKKGESFESFLRRFSKKLQQSKILREVRSRQYISKDKSRNMRRESALVRLELRKKKEYLRKIGKLPEDSR
jgi:ribosomal protein S21